MTSPTGQPLWATSSTMRAATTSASFTPRGPDSRDRGPRRPAARTPQGELATSKTVLSNPTRASRPSDTRGGVFCAGEPPRSTGRRPVPRCRCACRPCHSAEPSTASSPATPKIARTVPWIAAGFRAAMDAGDLSGPTAQLPRAGRPSVTSPKRSAVAAVTRSSVPMSAQRSTSPSGTPRWSIPIGSSAETIPAFACGSKNSASSAQTIDVGLVEEVLRAARDDPGTARDDGLPAAVVELGREAGAWIDAVPDVALGEPARASPLMSAPVENARSPFACSTTTCTSSVSRTVRQATPTRPPSCRWNAFIASARVQRDRATWSAPTANVISLRVPCLPISFASVGPSSPAGMSILLVCERERRGHQDPARTNVVAQIVDGVGVSDTQPADAAQRPASRDVRRSPGVARCLHPPTRRSGAS